MAENLNYNASGSKCYANQQANCDKYGRLYNWNTAMKACLSGWHLPSDTEWAVLMQTVGGNKTAGKQLKAKFGWNENGNGLDTYDFAALPSGSYFSGSFINAGYGSWWSATENNNSRTYRWYMYYGNDYIDKHYCSKKTCLFSVRCLKDNA